MSKTTTNAPAEAPRKDRIISLRLKPEEWAIIADDIEACGLSTNAYFRQLALENPLPRRTRPRAKDGSAKVCGKFLGHLGKAGSNLNQLAKQANLAGVTGEWVTMPSAKQIAEQCLELRKLLQDVQAQLLATMRSP